METGASEFQEWSYCYDDQCDEKDKELTTVLRVQKRGDEECQEQIL